MVKELAGDVAAEVDAISATLNAALKSTEDKRLELQEAFTKALKAGDTEALTHTLKAWRQLRVENEKDREANQHLSIAGTGDQPLEIRGIDFTKLKTADGAALPFDQVNWHHVTFKDCTFGQSFSKSELGDVTFDGCNFTPGTRFAMNHMVNVTATKSCTYGGFVASDNIMSHIDIQVQQTPKQKNDVLIANNTYVSDLNLVVLTTTEKKLDLEWGEIRVKDNHHDGSSRVTAQTPARDFSWGPAEPGPVHSYTEQAFPDRNKVQPRQWTAEEIKDQVDYYVMTPQEEKAYWKEVNATLRSNTKEGNDAPKGCSGEMRRILNIQGYGTSTNERQR